MATFSLVEMYCLHFQGVSGFYSPVRIYGVITQRLRHENSKLFPTYLIDGL